MMIARPMPVCSPSPAPGEDAAIVALVLLRWPEAAVAACLGVTPREVEKALERAKRGQA